MSGIATVPELRAYIDLEPGRADDLLLQGIIDSMSRFVENWTGRTFTPNPQLVNGVDSASPVTKTFVVSPNQSVVRIPDLRSATTIALGGVALQEAIGYQYDANIEPAQSIYLAVTPYGLGGVTYFGTTTLANKLQITGRWGFNPTPPDVKDCVLALAARRYKERNTAWADSLAMPDGSVLSYFRQLPASVQGALSMYKSAKVALV